MSIDACFVGARRTPVLYFGMDDESKEALLIVLDSGIKFGLRAGAEGPTPYVRVGYGKYEGLPEIKGLLKTYTQ